eukprot:s6084_g8.t3
MLYTSQHWDCAQMGSLTELLLATLDPSKNAQAEAQIRQAEQASVDQYFTALAQELANTEKPVVARQLAGLLLKNTLASKDPAKDRDLKARWANLPAASRNLVKEATTSALISPQTDVGKASAQVLAKIGAIEIPLVQWPGLVPLLLGHVTNTDVRARQISLVCLGYLCEDLVIVQEEGTNIGDDIANNILTAVVQGMRDTEPQTKLEATRAFYHAVVLAKKNFKNQVERDVIMGVVNETCRCNTAPEVQIAAFECLVQIATEYYDFLMPYMNGLGPLTWETIKSSPEKVAIPAMEFWSTICDEELYLMDLVEAGQAAGRASLNLIQQALSFLVPLLTETLTKRQSEDDDDTWNLAMAAGTCLALVAQVVRDGCVDLVLQFVHTNFQNPDWKFREAAVLAYGSIMEGPTSEKMRPMVEQSLSHLVLALQDQSVAVRDTIAWTLGRIAQFHPTIVPVKQLMPLLCERLRDVPRVSANICWNVQARAAPRAQEPSCLCAECRRQPTAMIPPPPLLGGRPFATHTQDFEPTKEGEGPAPKPPSDSVSWETSTCTPSNPSSARESWSSIKGSSKSPLSPQSGSVGAPKKPTLRYYTRQGRQRLLRRAHALFCRSWTFALAALLGTAGAVIVARLPARSMKEA